MYRCLTLAIIQLVQVWLMQCWLYFSFHFLPASESSEPVNDSLVDIEGLEENASPYKKLEYDGIQRATEGKHAGDISWEPEGHYHHSTMFHWEPEGLVAVQIYGDSGLLLLNGTLLNSNNALLVISDNIVTWSKAIWSTSLAAKCHIYPVTSKCLINLFSLLIILPYGKFL